MRFLHVLLFLAVAVGFGPSIGQSYCDPGWREFGDNCYFFNHDARGLDTWNDAVTTCQFLGGHLVDIRNEDEWQFVKVNLRKGGQYMIGMTDAASEGHWKYTDGNPVSFFIWKKGEPNSGRRENCGTIFSDATIGRYNDGPCTHKYGRFICKKRFRPDTKPMEVK